MTTRTWSWTGHVVPALLSAALLSLLVSAPPAAGAVGLTPQRGPDLLVTEATGRILTVHLMAR